MLRFALGRYFLSRRDVLSTSLLFHRNPATVLENVQFLPRPRFCSTVTKNVVDHHHARKAETKTAYSKIADAYNILRHRLQLPALKPAYTTIPEHGLKGSPQWKTTLTIKWPEKLTFEACCLTKRAAEEQAAEQAFNKLQELGIVSETGKLLVQPRRSREVHGDWGEEIQTGPQSTGDYNVTKEELKETEKIFPASKGTLVQTYIRASEVLKDPNIILKPHYFKISKSHNSLWQCMYHIRWPENRKFVGIGKNRAEADRWAALMALHWLHSQGYLHKDGYPILYTQEQYESWKTSLKNPCPVEISKGFRDELNELANSYKDMKALLDEDAALFETRKDLVQKLGLDEEEDLATEEEERELEESLNVARTSQVNEEMDEDDYPLDVITGRHLKPMSPANIERLNEELYDDCLRRRARSSSGSFTNLPIAATRKQILDLVNRNQVVVLSGDTGCGKSTQMPQYILDHWAELGKGADCNIIVTQPRRLAAISLAQTVAREMGEQVGNRVGYQIRLNSVLPQQRGGRVLFCSTGILLRKLQVCPELTGISHLIIDEVHERDVLTDFLLILLKDVLKNNPQLKVILMSASLNAGLLSEYFSRAPLFHVSGRMYPVQQHFLPEVLQLLSKQPGLRAMVPRNASVASRPQVDLELVTKVIRYIDSNRPVDGAILCFLPGWQDIKYLYDKLKEFYPSEESHWILPVHSRLSQKEQERIFEKPNGNVRKIVLATNIAETSLTIKDVVYVVDPGIHKELRHSQQHGVAVMENHWISRANVQQRKGRAGRVQPGESFHLFTQERFESMDHFPQAEILRIPLEKVVIDIKAYDETIPAADFLERALEPPSTRATRDATRDLQNIGVLNRDERFTWLGRRIANFTTDPRLAKALVYSVIFRCVDPVVSAVAALTAAREPWELGMDVRAALRAVKQKLHPTSDHLALVNLIKGFREERGIGRHAAEDFCRNNKANFGTLHFINGVRRLLAEHLYDADLLESVRDAEDLQHVCNSNSDNEELVCAVLLQGIGDRLLRVRKGTLQRGVIKQDEVVPQNGNGGPVAFLNDGVNGDDTNIKTPFLFYFNGVYLPERRTFAVRDSSQVSALTALLMAGSRVSKLQVNEEEGEVVLGLDDKPNWRFVLPEKDADLLLELRHCVQDTTDCLLRYIGQESLSEAASQAIALHRKQVDLISRILRPH